MLTRNSPTWTIGSGFHVKLGRAKLSFCRPDHLGCSFSVAGLLPGESLQELAHTRPESGVGACTSGPSPLPRSIKLAHCPGGYSI